MAYRLNRLLVRLEMERGASEAASREIARQLAEQGLPNINVVSPNVDIKPTFWDVRINGESCDWIEDAS